MKFVEEGKVKKSFSLTSIMESVPLTAENLEQADVVVLTTNHSAFDVEFIQQHAKMIVDLRNMVKEGNEKVYKL